MIYISVSLAEYMSKTSFYPSPKRIEKLSKEEQLDLIFDLLNAFRIVKTPLETAFLLQDLLTAKEIRNLSKRLRIAKLLVSGKTQREIADDIHCSFATIDKVRTWLEQGGEGLRIVIGRLPKRYQMPKRMPPGPLEYNLPQLLLTLAQYTAAKGQERQLKNFSAEIERKKRLDRQLREKYSEYFKRPRK